MGSASPGGRGWAKIEAFSCRNEKLNVSGGQVFRDDPLAAGETDRKFEGHRREESLGSLVNSPAREDFDHGRSGGNAFRDEIVRQQTGR